MILYIIHEGLVPYLHFLTASTWHIYKQFFIFLNNLRWDQVEAIEIQASDWQ